MSNKLVSILFFALFFLPLVTAPAYAVAPDLAYTFKEGYNASIIRPCFNTLSATGWCSSNATCQLTITDQNNELLVSGANMTNQISYHNLTTNISENGFYKADMACFDNSQSGSDTFYFGINRAGTDYSTNNSIMFLLGVTIVLMIVFGLFAYFLEQILRIVFMLLAGLMLPVSLWITSQIANNSFFDANLINIIDYGYIISLMFFVALALYSLIKLTSQLKVRDNKQEGATTASGLYPEYSKSKEDNREYKSSKEFEEEE